MADLPVGRELLDVARRLTTVQAIADHFDVPRTTMRDHIWREGLKEEIKAIWEREALAQDFASIEEKPAEIPIVRRDYSSSERHYIYPLGDVHKGAPTHDPDRWHQWLDYLVERSDASLLGTGDFLNAGLKDSKSEAYDETHTVGGAKRELRREFATLATTGRIDCLMPGNHEDRIYRAVGDCPIHDICDSLNVPYVEASALLVYTVGDFEYEVYIRHGTGNGQSLTMLAKSGNVIRADVYVTGHTHRQAVAADDFFVRAGNRVIREKRYFVSSGSFLGYEKYAAQRGYPPSRLGAPRIFLDGRRRDIHVSL